MPDGLADVVKDEYGANLSRERADLLDVDALVWLVPNPEKDKATLAGDEIYNKLPVFRNGGDVYLADGSDDNAVSTLGSATSFVTVLSLPYLIDNLVPLIAAAADGDPATEVEDESRP
jgi:iron complex transport system substrate-binding protein